MTSSISLWCCCPQSHHFHWLSFHFYHSLQQNKIHQSVEINNLSVNQSIDHPSDQWYRSSLTDRHNALSVYCLQKDMWHVLLSSIRATSRHCSRALYCDQSVNHSFSHSFNPFLDLPIYQSIKRCINPTISLPSMSVLFSLIDWQSAQKIVNAISLIHMNNELRCPCLLSCLCA